MKQGISICISAIFFLGLLSSAQAVPEALVKLREEKPNTLVSCSPFDTDAMTLSVVDGGKVLAQKEFCSSYGEAKAKTFITRDGKIFVLLERGEGRGTNAVTNYLEIDRVHNKEFDEVARIPIEWGIAPQARFQYRYLAREDSLGGLEINLKGRKFGKDDDDCCIPPEPNKTIRIDP